MLYDQSLTSHNTQNSRGDDLGLYTANATLVCVLSDITSAVTLLFCVWTEYLGDGAADRLESLHDGRAASRTVFSSFGGNIFRGIQMRGKKGFRLTIFGLSYTDFCHLTAHISKAVSQCCQLELNISSTM